MNPGSDCPTGKIQYTDGARDQRDFFRRQGDRNVRAYRCPWCSTFHVGHTTRKRDRLRARSGQR